MIDEGRWLRPDRQLAWRDIAWSMLVSWSTTAALIALIWYWSPEIPIMPLMISAGVIGGIVTPVGLIALDETHRSVRRGEAWLVSSMGILIWRRGAVVHSYPWSEIRDAGGAMDQVRMVPRNDGRVHRLNFQRSSEVRWFRDYARDRVTEAVERSGPITEAG